MKRRKVKTSQPKVRAAKRQNGERRMRPWLRRVGVVVVFLLAGAIINVLVAWGLAWNGAYSNAPTLKFGASAPDEGYAYWSVSRSRTFGRARFSSTWWYHDGFGRFGPIGVAGRYHPHPSTILPHWMSSARPNRSGNGGSARTGHGFGFPMISLWWEESGDTQLSSGGIMLRPTGIRLEAGMREMPPVPRVLPVRPIWSGTIANVSVYAASLGVFILVGHIIRRRHRNSRGLCTSCGYDLRGADHGKCPECGEAVVS